MNSPDMPTDLPSALHKEKARLELQESLREYREFWLAESKRLTEEIQKEREAHVPIHEKQEGFRYQIITPAGQDDGGTTEEAPGENQEQSGAEEDSGRGQN